MQIQLSPKLMKIAHKIVQVPEMKFLLRPFIHNVKRNNQNIHEIFQEKSHVYYWGRFVKKYQKRFDIIITSA